MKEFLDVWRRVSALLIPSERWELVGVFVSSLVVAAIETVGVASVLPFMAVVMNPSAFEKYAVLRQFTQLTGGLDQRHRLVALGVTVGVVVLFSNAAAAMSVWLQQTAAGNIRTRLGKELFRRFLFQNYSFHIANDGPTLVGVLVNDIDSLARLIAQALQFSSRVCVVTALVLLLLFQNPTIAVWALLVLGGSYAIIYRLVRDRQTALGESQTHAWVMRQRVAQESLAGVKELQVLGREHPTVQRFGTHAHMVSDVWTKNLLLSAAPRYLLEPIGIGGILGVAIFLILTTDNAAAGAVPTLALYAFVGYRLLPAMQQIYSAATDIKFVLPSVLKLHAYYVNAFVEEQPDPASLGPRSPSTDNVVITLDKVTFTYAGAARAAVSDISLDIVRGQSVGIVGKSGSGKTTLADIILGLHLPQGGTIRTADGLLDQHTVRAWHRRIGYVPQHVFLANASVLENIAFGLPLERIDRGAAERAVRMAQADEFIALLPDGLDTIIGERGVVLSGGQRQRLGIARALYSDPEVLVFDEATSALDGVTEGGVMDAIHALTGDRTVILIAHRLETIEACDRIIHMDAGRVVGEGAFNDLLANSATFREFTNRDTPVSS